jgi:hypothetical protein
MLFVLFWQLSRFLVWKEEDINVLITLCDNVCQKLATGRWFSPVPPVSSTNKTDRHDITEILLKVALSNIKPTKIDIANNAVFF